MYEDAEPGDSDDRKGVRDDDSAPVADFVRESGAEHVDHHLHDEVEADEERDLIERDAEGVRVGDEQKRR